MAIGIFIEGARKPTECSRRCYLADQLTGDCMLMVKSNRLNSFEEQYKHCPLKEVDVVDETIACDCIDRASLINNLMHEDGEAHRFCSPCKEILQAIENEPAVTIMKR